MLGGDFYKISEMHSDPPASNYSVVNKVKMEKPARAPYHAALQALDHKLKPIRRILRILHLITIAFGVEKGNAQLLVWSICLAIVGRTTLRSTIDGVVLLCKKGAKTLESVFGGVCRENSSESGDTEESDIQGKLVLALFSKGVARKSISSTRSATKIALNGT